MIATLLVRGEAMAGESAAKTALSTIGNGRSTSVTGDLRNAATRHRERRLHARPVDHRRCAPRAARCATGQVSDGHGRLCRTGRRGRRPSGARHQLPPPRLPPREDRPGPPHRHGGPDADPQRQLVTTDRELAGLGSSWLVGPLKSRAVSLRTQLDRAQHSSDLAVEAAKVLPAMLGGDGVRHYFIAFMSPSESRGYDGFVGSYGLLTADNGHVSLTTSGVTSDLETQLPPGGATLRGVQGFLARYGQFQPGQVPARRHVLAEPANGGQRIGAGVPPDGWRTT